MHGPAPADRDTNVRVDESALVAQQFEMHRAHLRGVAYRMLGS
jgi:hypothetical protein